MRSPITNTPLSSLRVADSSRSDTGGVVERVGDHPQRAVGSVPWTVGATPHSTPSDAEELCGTRGGACGSQREADELPTNGPIDGEAVFGWLVLQATLYLRPCSPARLPHMRA